MSPALAGRLLSTAPPGKSSGFHLRSWDRKEHEREFPGIPELSLRGAQIQSLAGELRPHKPRGQREKGRKESEFILCVSLFPGRCLLRHPKPNRCHHAHGQREKVPILLSPSITPSNLRCFFIFSLHLFSFNTELSLSLILTGDEINSFSKA